MRFEKKGVAIGSMEEWFKYAPPARGIRHWRNGRSAKELARAWFPDTGSPWFAETKCPRVPQEFKDLLQLGSDDSIELAEPECRSRFDAYTGPSNLDLVLVGHLRGLKTLFAVEAKADEPFGDEIKLAGQGSKNVADRIDSMCQTLFGATLANRPELGDLRYQLLTGVAGALAEGNRHKAAQVCFVIHVFDSSGIDRNAANINNNAYRNFVAALANDQSVPNDVLSGMLFGPMRIQRITSYLPQLPLYVGKCERNVDDIVKLLAGW